MSLENQLKELTDAINKLPENLAALMSAGRPAATTALVESKPAAEKAESKPAEKAEPKAEAATAGRRTYIFFKETKQGTIVEKGEVLPTENGAQGVNKTTWENLCQKYNLNPATGHLADAGEEASGADDFDDLDEDTASSASSDAANAAGTDGDDLDDDLGLDAEEEATGPSLADVKAKLVALMKATNREMVLKVMRKFGAENADGLKDADYADVITVADRQIAKAKG